MNIAGMLVSLIGVAICAALLGFIFGWRAGFAACARGMLDRWSEGETP